METKQNEPLSSVGQSIGLSRPFDTKRHLVASQEASSAFEAEGWDSLISAAIGRRQLLDHLDRLVISEVSRRSHRKRLRRWAYVVAFSFGLPLLLLLTCAGVYTYIIRCGISSFTLFLMAWPVLGILFTFYTALRNFSPDDV